MTKLELEAIRRLPRRYVRDGTCVGFWAAVLDPLTVVAVHADLPPIVFRAKGGKWKVLGVAKRTNEKVSEVADDT